jgi:hypothetical protein
MDVSFTGLAAYLHMGVAAHAKAAIGSVVETMRFNRLVHPKTHLKACALRDTVHFGSRQG